MPKFRDLTVQSLHSGAPPTDPRVFESWFNKCALASHCFKQQCQSFLTANQNSPQAKLNSSFSHKELLQFQKVSTCRRKLNNILTETMQRLIFFPFYTTAFSASYGRPPRKIIQIFVISFFCL